MPGALVSAVVGLAYSAGFAADLTIKPEPVEL